jgi:UDP-N-acetylglucosamine 1-carboxyvinyltransferase
VQRILVRGGHALAGTIPIGGAKNSALKLMAATLLAEGRYTIANVPRIVDVEIMSDVLTSMGVDVTRANGDRLVIDCPRDLVPHAPYELVERMRASIVVLGPLLARAGVAHVAVPGGDNFGPRPIDMHLRGLEALGASFETAHGYIDGRCDQLTGGRVMLEFPSVGATENVLMAAVRAKGTTVIDNAAREPEIADLAAFLVAMGARVDGAGTSTIEIEGVEELRPVDHTVIPDRIEAGTFLTAVGVAGGEVMLRGANAAHMDMLLSKLTEMGMHVVAEDDGVFASCATGGLRSVDVSTLPYPGVATDYKPFFAVLLALADGVGIITENLFAGRFAYVDELVRMGADIRTEGHHMLVRGGRRLSGAPVRAPDIRAGAALVIAGLGAEGETVVSDAHHIARGYEDLPGKLRAVGADVEAVAGAN